MACTGSPPREAGQSWREHKLAYLQQIQQAGPEAQRGGAGG